MFPAACMHIMEQVTKFQRSTYSRIRLFIHHSVTAAMCMVKFYPEVLQQEFNSTCKFRNGEFTEMTDGVLHAD